jgi:hypothetical protein
LPDLERRPPPPELPEESPNFFDERFDFEEPFDLLESTEPPVATTETSGDAEESTEKRPRRRRRRRGRGRGRGGEQRDSADREPVAREEREEREECEESDQEPEGPVEAIGEERSSEDGESPDGRSRRRRPRRGRHRRDRESAPTAAGEPAEPREPSHEPSRLRDDEPLDADLFADDGLELGEDEQAESDQPARLGFRGIPPWDEVVGLLIDKNIEAHAKRPAGSHHGRGGNRGPRDNRGGNRGGDKRR